MTEHEIQARQESDQDIDAEQARLLELCACHHTRGAHVRAVRKGEYVIPCALCRCNDFQPEDYVPLDNFAPSVTMQP